MRGGFITWPARPAYPPCACQIKDISVRGARVHAPGAPDGVDVWSAGARLYFVVEGHEVPCLLSWRDGDAIGLRFVGRPEAATRRYG